MLRFAPSPTQSIDLNNLRIAIFNYIVSKQKNEQLVIRIEDIDKEKNIEGIDKEILEILNLFSIDYSRVVHQSESLKYHQKMVMQLLTQKKAFVCFCSQDKLDELKEEANKKGEVFSYDGFCETLSDETVLNTNAPFNIRIKKPNSDVKFTDLINSEITSKPNEIDSFIVLNHQKAPTYNYACAFDDMMLDISTVIRDEKYLKDTAKQIHLRNQLSYEKQIDYIHIKSLANGNIFVKDLIDDGFLPSAIANYLVLLGSECDDEIFTLEEAIKWFDISKISNENQNFDMEKLKQINKKHLEEIDEMRLSKILGFADADIGKLAKLFLDESNTIKELKENIDLIFSSKSTYINFEKEFVELKVCLNDAPYFDKLDDLITYIAKNTNLNENDILRTLKYIILGKETNFDLSKVYDLVKNYLGEIVK